MDNAFQVLVIGFSVVMFTLIVLYGILVLFGYLFYQKDQGVAVDTVSARPDLRVGGEEVGPDKRLTAAIIAAVYTYIKQHKLMSTAGQISIAFQPSESIGKSTWKSVGRKALLDNRVELENLRRKKRRENI